MGVVEKDEEFRRERRIRMAIDDILLSQSIYEHAKQHILDLTEQQFGGSPSLLKKQENHLSRLSKLSVQIVEEAKAFLATLNFTNEKEYALKYARSLKSSEIDVEVVVNDAFLSKWTSRRI